MQFDFFFFSFSFSLYVYTNIREIVYKILTESDLLVFSNFITCESERIKTIQANVQN